MHHRTSPRRMGRSARVDQLPMLFDDEVAMSRSTELARIVNPDYAVAVREDVGVPNAYPSISLSGVITPDAENDDGKHEHLLRSGPMGRCNDPYCSTCPSYFGYSEGGPPLGTHRRKNSSRVENLRSTAISWGQSIPGFYILNPHSKIVQRWNKIFCISSLIAIFVDPVFFLLLSVDDKNYCLVFNNAAAWAVTVIRTITDTIHVIHIYLQFRLAYVAPSSKIRNAGELEDRPKKIAVNYFKHWFILDLFTALPLPQVLIWTTVKRMLGKERGANYAKDVLRVVVLIQNIPRSIRFFPLLIGRAPQGFVFETAWANFVINLLMYVLAGHIVGCCWYLFGLQRVNQCLEDACRNETGNCTRSFLDCGDNLEVRSKNETYLRWMNSTLVGNNCLFSPTFKYGIYASGVQVVVADSTFTKYVYSLFWGFQQISTLAGNQVPSTFIWEVLFTMGIVALGLLLFALLIGNMQNFLLALGRRRLDMQLKRYDTDFWMDQRKLPVSLQKRVRQAVRYKWRCTGGVEENELIRNLPEDLQKDIQRYLCLDLVKKVRLFELLEDHVLDAICERLYQKLYIEKSDIFRAKQPVDRMLFIVRGQLESRGEDNSTVGLKEGSFCGEELLSWYLDMTGVSMVMSSAAPKKVKNKNRHGKYPLSSRTVTCMTSVEAFALDAEGLEYITTHYKAALLSPRVRGVIRYLSPYWRSQAAIRIQKAWRASSLK